MRTQTRTGLLAGLLFLSGCPDPLEPGVCPAGRTDMNGLCRKDCTDASDCLISERCAPPGVCLPEDDGMVQFKQFEVTPRAVQAGDAVSIEYAVLFADRLELAVVWADETRDVLITDDSVHVGSHRLGNIQQSGTIELVAFKDGVSEVRTEGFVLDNGQPAIVRFDVDRGSVQPGGVVQLSWEVINPIGPITLRSSSGPDQPRLEAVGTLDQTVNVNTTFTLETVGPTGLLQASLEVQVETVVGPQIVRFERLSPAVLAVDAPIAFAWEVQGVTQVTLRERGMPIYQTRAPFDLPIGAAIIDMPTGSHAFTLEAANDAGLTAVSAIVPVVVAAPTPPVINMFTVSPAYFSTQPAEISAEWSILPIVPPSIQTTFDFGDGMGPMMAPLDDLRTRIMNNGEGTARIELRASSPAGIARASATVWRLAPEVEPNDTPGQAMPLFGDGVEATTGGGDPDFFNVGFVDGNRTVRARLLDTPCAAGVTVTIADMLGNMVSGCPEVELESFGGDVLVNVVVTNGQELNYRLIAEIEEPVCGDGFTEFMLESCDDGNLAAGDGCSPLCQLEEVTSYREVDEMGVLAGRPGSARSVQFTDYPNADGGYAVVELPVPFTLYEETYAAMLIHANGFVSFLPELDFGDASAPLNGQPDAVIAAVAAGARGDTSDVDAWVWDDGSTLSVEWAVDAGATVARLTLYQGGDIGLAYPQVGAPERGFTAGVEDRRGIRRTFLEGCDPTCSDRLVSGLSVRLIPEIILPPAGGGN